MYLLFIKTHFKTGNIQSIPLQTTYTQLRNDFKNIPVSVNIYLNSKKINLFNCHTALELCPWD